MKIIYLSKTCSKKMFHEIYDQSIVKPQQQDQRFHQMMIEGIHLNDIDIEVISSRPINRGNLKNLYFKHDVDFDQIKYHHLGFINFKILRQISLYLNAKKVIHQIIKNTSAPCILVVDTLNLSLSKASLNMAKKYHLKTVAITTDLPTALEKGSSNFKKFIQKLIFKYDYHVALSKYLIKDLNISKPFCIIEGMTDDIDLENANKDSTFTILYAGNLSETSGIHLLLEAFDSLILPNSALKICGSGKLSNLVFEYQKKNHDIIYLGNLKNEEVLDLEKSSSLLINPRQSDHPQTIYAFPSKILEYMSSGTMVLSTKLKGIPDEYDPYLKWIEKEDVLGFKNAIFDIYQMDQKSRITFGEKARLFVKTYKNKKVQTKKLIDMLKE